MSSSSKVALLSAANQHPPASRNWHDVSLHARFAEAAMDLRLQRQVDIGHRFMLRCFRHQVEILEIKREIAQLLAAFIPKQPIYDAYKLAITSVDLVPHDQLE